MELELRFSNANHSAGETVNIPLAELEDLFIHSQMHLGTMTDMIVSRYRLTRGDAATIADNFFFVFEE